MKRTICIILFLNCCFALRAQKGYQGEWSGKLQLNVPLRLVLHIKDSAGLSATMDSPDQNVFGIRSETVTIADDSITVQFSRPRAKFSGRLRSGAKNSLELDGSWKQGNYRLPLLLTKIDGKSRPDERPQHPKPPFDYLIEDVVYTNEGKTVTLGGTLTIPRGNKKHPVVILISGSGPQDRDETTFGHKPFWVMADYFTKRGFAVLRVDDRGVGKSKGEIANVTSLDFAQDVIISLEYLLTRKEIDKERVGLIGHSEGGIIAPMVASKKKIAFMILLAAPAVIGGELLDEQRIAILTASGVPAGIANEYRALSQQMNKIILNANDKEIAINQSQEAIGKWLETASVEAKGILQLSSIEQAKAYAVQSVNQMYNPWFRYFLAFKPVDELTRSNCPVLAIYGEKDIQVLASQNTKPMEMILKQSRKLDTFKVMEMKGMNHLFQLCNTCTLNEYAVLTETFSEEVLKVMIAWMESIVHNKN
jgi:pimeloyl-ACP methyl ester carboxylesterase